jgi:hypothetical protein
MSKIKDSLIAPGFLLALFIFAPIATYGQAAKPSADVNVVNTPSVRDADNPAHQPVQAIVSCLADNVLGCSEIIYTVPQGKRLVIEFASMEATLTADQKAQLKLDTTAGGATVTHNFPLTPPAVVFQGEAVVSTLAQQVRLYADGGTSVEIKARRNNIGPAFLAFFRVSISGYLVDSQ